MTVSITINGTPYDVPSSAADTNWAAQQVAFEQALATFANATRTLLNDTAAYVGDWNLLEWAEMSPLANDWEPSSGGQAPRYAQQPNGVVWIVAALEGNVGVSSGLPAFTLTEALRPNQAISFICAAGSALDKAALVTVGADGAIVITPTLGSVAEDVEELTNICISYPTTTVA